MAELKVTSDDHGAFGHSEAQSPNTGVRRGAGIRAGSCCFFAKSMAFFTKLCSFCVFLLDWSWNFSLGHSRRTEIIALQYFNKGYLGQHLTVKSEDILFLVPFSGFGIRDHVAPSSPCGPGMDDRDADWVFRLDMDNFFSGGHDLHDRSTDFFRRSVT
jgi:hypothetical protein